MPMSLSEQHLIVTHSHQTQQLAAMIAAQAQPGTVLLLQGDLGSGKTTFVQGLGQGLGIEAVINSPTFVLVQEYPEGRIPLIHCDLYRLTPAAVADLGLDELWQAEAITVIEWANRLPLQPDRWLNLQFEILGETCRRITATWAGSDHAQLWQASVERFRELFGSSTSLDAIDQARDQKNPPT